MIATIVDHHVSRMWHVAVDALRPRRANSMVMMVWRVVFACGMLMARSANLITRMNQLGRMHIVAVATLDPVMKHLGLSERTDNVVFISNLAIHKVSRFIDRLQHKVLVKIAARFKSLFDFSSPRVTRRTSIDLS